MQSPDCGQEDLFEFFDLFEVEDFPSEGLKTPGRKPSVHAARAADEDKPAESRRDRKKSGKKARRSESVSEEDVPEKSLGREIAEMLLEVIIVVALSALFLIFVAQRTEVEGHSMEATLQDGDSLILDKLTYRLRDPERFEIVVFDYDSNTRYIKRVIGLPGETVQIVDSVIYINGEPLEENYGLEEIEDPGIAAEPITLGEDEYFVLGDNRNHSSDSRREDVGPIDRSQICGRAIFRVWPLSGWGNPDRIYSEESL